MHPLFVDAEKVHVKDEGGIGRDKAAAGAAAAVTQLRRNAQLALAANLHPGDALVPSLDDLAGAKRKDKRIVAVHRAVDFLPSVSQPV